MAQQPHYTVFQEMRQQLVDWGYNNLDDWFEDERGNCEELLDWLQQELQGRQVEAIQLGHAADEGHADRIAKLEDTITIVQKMIAEIDGESSLETTGLPMQSGQAPEDEDPEDEAPQEEPVQDEDGEQDMAISDGE